jgi:carboxypeptidase PM20D1
MFHGRLVKPTFFLKLLLNMKRVFLSLLAIVFILLAIIFFNTLRFTSSSAAVEATPPAAANPAAIDHLIEGISYKTISFGDSSKFDSSQFIGFRKFLERTYPLVHKNLTREIVDGYSLLFTWTGKNPKTNPVVLMAHQDVVPVEEQTSAMWTSDPFKGVVKDDYIWGRGSADDKINLISILESCETLLSKGFQPERTIYLAFGHNEEVEGTGAIAMAKLLKSRDVMADLVLDEGGIITAEKIPGMENRPVALLGTSEKGAMSLELRVEKSGGHSAMPEAETAIDILAKAITRLRAKNFEPRFSPSTEGFLQAVGPEMPFEHKIVFANLWLFTPVVHGIYEKTNTGNAMIRTTIAPTILSSGIKDNVVPTVATATINLRLLPGDSSRMVIGRVKSLIADDRVTIRVKGKIREGTEVTSAEGYGFQKVAEAIRKTHENVVASPFLMIAATDSRYFSEVSDNIIKFSPMIDPIGFHGIDERVSLQSFNISLAFYERLISDLR